MKPISVYAPDAIKAQLQKAANKNIRSLSGEVVARLVASLKEKK